MSSILGDIRFYEHKSSETIKISELLSYHPLIDFTCLARSGSRLIFSCALMNWSTSARASSVVDSNLLNEHQLKAYCFFQTFPLMDTT